MVLKTVTGSSIEDNLPAFEENASDEFWAKYFAEFQEKLAKKFC
jgi:hypothetical protein